MELTIFQGRAGDHNDLAIPGALAIGKDLSARLGLTPMIVGQPEPALSADWTVELPLALPALYQMQARMDAIYAKGGRSLAATSRCAVSLATLPAVLKHHPDAVVVWFDSHADLNTPEATSTGYLGGLALAGPAGLWESGLGTGLPLSQIILVGERDLDPFEVELISAHQIPHIMPGPDIAANLARALNGRKCYTHLDCDVLNPGIVPTDYVHDGGLTLEELQACARVLEPSSIGLEIAEFQISWSNGGAEVSPEKLLDALQPLTGASSLIQVKPQEM